MNATHYPHDYTQYRRHRMFQLVRSYVIERAGGICECCKERPVTEVHHKNKRKDRRYPAWGAFDTPSNLEALCHECHCKRHGRRT